MRILAVALAVGALALGAAAVQADPVQAPLSIKVGNAWPSQSQAKYDEGNNVLTAGLDYAVSKNTGDEPSIGSVYFDYTGGTRHSGHLNTYGVGVAARAYGTNPGGNASIGAATYYGAGVGLYRVDDKDLGLDKTNSSIGGKVFAGVEFGKSLLAEIGYQWLPKADGADPSSFIAEVGLRL
ncbi:MAG: hypothetical protein P4L33_15205 [Capsulimonadaceae bacterium]|nr:hypothetical protein [Capsulimonadaceae bacterium]